MRLLVALLINFFLDTYAFLPLDSHAHKGISSWLKMADGEEPRLVLGDEVQSELSKIKTKYPTSEADYLAAARARSAAKTASTQIQATEEQLQKLAAEKKALMGEGEGFSEDGDPDSPILMPGEKGDDPEDKLMLF